MSTWDPWSLTCPDCGTQQEVRVLKGIHISRLPEVRQALFEGHYQTFVCPGCKRKIQVEAETVCTDFPNHNYVAVEVHGTPDWRAAKRKHLAIFDACFTFGPEPAQDLGSELRTRLVFGTHALREKLLAWDMGLDDRALEAVKGDLLAARGVAVRDEELRVSQVLDGGHIIFARLDPTPPVRLEERRLLPVPEYRVRGFETAPVELYQRRLLGISRIARDYPWLTDDWVVDLHITAPAA